MKFLTTLCITALRAFTALAQSQPTMLSQSRYYVEPGGVIRLEDSVTHTHSNGRVSYGLPVVTLTHSPNDGVYTADESIRVYKNLASSGLYLVDRMTRVFNTAGQISEYHEQTKVAGSLMETLKEWYHYNQDSQLDTSWINTSTIARRHTYIYQNGIQRAGIYEKHTVNPPELLGVDSFLANGTDSLYVLYWKTNPPAPPQVYEKHKYQRDANLRVVVDSFFQYNNFSRVTYTTYNVSGRKAVDSVFFAGPAAFNNHKNIYLYDNNDNLISINQHVWDPNSSSYIPTHLDTMTYNPVNQLTSARSFTLSGSTWTPRPESVSRFYYYGFPAGINDVASDKNFRLYPVPATTYINLDITFNKPEKFAVRIMDMQGRIVRSWEEPAQGAYTKKLQLDGMSAGNYIVSVISENSNITRQFSVIQ